MSGRILKKSIAGLAKAIRARAATGIFSVIAGIVLIGSSGFPESGLFAQAPDPAPSRRDAEKPGANIQWTPVPGAREYLFEVRNAKKASVLRRTVKQPKILLRLPEGQYEMRSQAVDRFRRQTPWSDWAPLRIRYAIPPRILSVSPEEYAPTTADTGRLIELRGKNFVRATEVRVFVDSTPVTVRNVDFIDGDTLRFALPGDAPEGQYDVLVVNPGDVRSRMAAAFRVKRSSVADGPGPDRAEPGPNSEASREDLPTDFVTPGFSMTSLLPGLPDFARGRYIRGSLWVGAFLGAGFAAFSGYQAASTASSGALSNPLYPSFSNPLYLYGLVTFGTGTNAGLYAFNTNQIFNDVQSQYNAGRSQYTTFGGAALLVYFTHLAFHAFTGPELPEYDAQRTQPGVSVWIGPTESFERADLNLGVRPQNDPDIRFAWSLSF